MKILLLKHTTARCDFGGLAADITITREIKNLDHELSFFAINDSEVLKYVPTTAMEFFDQRILAKFMAHNHKLCALIKTNDLIFATVRPTHSRVALITKEYNEQICSTGYCVLRPKNCIISNLIYYFLLTYNFNEQMEKLQKGASYPAVTDNEVKSIKITYPTLIDEQVNIIKTLDLLLKNTKQLETIYQQKLTKLEELKKSILQKAFNGELI